MRTNCRLQNDAIIKLSKRQQKCGPARNRSRAHSTNIIRTPHRLPRLSCCDSGPYSYIAIRSQTFPDSTKPAPHKHTVMP